MNKPAPIKRTVASASSTADSQLRSPADIRAAETRPPLLRTILRSAFAVRPAGVNGQRGVNVSSGDQVQRGGGDADHGSRRTVESDGAADERAVCAKAPFPEAFADHGDGGSTGLLFGIGEITTDYRRD